MAHVAKTVAAWPGLSLASSHPSSHHHTMMVAAAITHWIEVGASQIVIGETLLVLERSRGHSLLVAALARGHDVIVELGRERHLGRLSLIVCRWKLNGWHRRNWRNHHNGQYLELWLLLLLMFVRRRPFIRLEAGRVLFVCAMITLPLLLRLLMNLRRCRHVDVRLHGPHKSAALELGLRLEF